MSSTPHPTIAGVTVDDGDTWRDIHFGKHWVFADTRDNKIILKGNGIPLNDVDIFLAVIRDQAAWLAAQGATT